MLFSERIRNLRRERNELQRDLAKLIGVDVPMYSRYEHGERRPKREQVVKLARRFKVDPQELVALWLAEQAFGLIATDRMADRASQLLLEQLGGQVASQPQESPTPAPTQTTPAPTPQVAPLPSVPRTLVASLGTGTLPHYEVGNAREVMNRMEDESIDCIVTTPPYWSLRRHRTDGITTDDLNEFVNDLVATKRVLKPEGSLWLNMADAYTDGALQAVPWRVVLRLLDEQGWILRNDVVWNKQQSAFDSAVNHLRNTHEHLFHLVKDSRFYFDDEQLRQAFNAGQEKKARTAGRTTSGITGERYMRRIQQSTALTTAEKKNAIADLRATLERVNNGEIPDFRLFLRDKAGEAVEGTGEKATAINRNGYYLLIYNRNGAMPPDVWDIAPAHSDIDRYAVAPEELYRLPIIATCPPGGIVLDPYCGTGTACKVAYDLNRRSIGIDVNGRYVDRARSRVEQRSLSLF